MHFKTASLRIQKQDFERLLHELGPSLALWRAAEIAALRQVHFKAPVVDLGCGDGLVTSFILPSVAVGVDPDEKSLKKAGIRGIYQRLDCSKIQKAMICEGSINTVLSNSVLEHIEEIDETLQQVARILRPGGRLVFTVPSEFFSGALALPVVSYVHNRNRRFGHLNLWDVNEWKRRLDQVGLDLEFTQLYLQPALVRMWDVMELLQQWEFLGRRLFGMTWRRLPPTVIRKMAGHWSKVDFACDAPAGGRLLVATKRSSFVPPEEPSIH